VSELKVLSIHFPNQPFFSAGFDYPDAFGLAD
jgi:hypothetical protein